MCVFVLFIKRGVLKKNEKGRKKDGVTFSSLNDGGASPVPPAVARTGAGETGVSFDVTQPIIVKLSPFFFIQFVSNISFSFSILKFFFKHLCHYNSKWKTKQINQY